MSEDELDGDWGEVWDDDLANDGRREQEMTESEPEQRREKWPTVDQIESLKKSEKQLDPFEYIFCPMCSSEVPRQNVMAFLHRGESNNITVLSSTNSAFYHYLCENCFRNLKESKSHYVNNCMECKVDGTYLQLHDFVTPIDQALKAIATARSQKKGARARSRSGSSSSKSDSHKIKRPEDAEIMLKHLVGDVALAEVLWSNEAREYDVDILCSDIKDKKTCQKEKHCTWKWATCNFSDEKAAKIINDIVKNIKQHGYGIIETGISYGIILGELARKVDSKTRSLLRKVTVDYLADEPTIRSNDVVACIYLIGQIVTKNIRYETKSIEYELVKNFIEKVVPFHTPLIDKLTVADAILAYLGDSSSRSGLGLSWTSILLICLVFSMIIPGGALFLDWMNNKDYRPSIPEELAFELNAIGIPASIVHVPQGTHDLIQSTVTGSRIDSFFTDEVQYEIVEVDVPWRILGEAMHGIRLNALGVMADLRRNMESYHPVDTQHWMQRRMDLNRILGNLNEDLWQNYRHHYETMILGPQVDPLGHQAFESVGLVTLHFTKKNIRMFFQAMLVFGGLFFILNAKTVLMDIYRERRDFRGSEIVRIQEIFMILVNFFEHFKNEIDTQRNEHRRERNRRQIAANQSGGACRRHRHRHRDPRVNKKSRKSYRL
jgi:hypothetical protein